MCRSCLRCKASGQAWHHPDAVHTLTQLPAADLDLPMDASAPDPAPLQNGDQSEASGPPSQSPQGSPPSQGRAAPGPAQHPRGVQQQQQQQGQARFSVGQKVLYAKVGVEQPVQGQVRSPSFFSPLLGPGLGFIGPVCSSSTKRGAPACCSCRACRCGCQQRQSLHVGCHACSYLNIPLMLRQAMVPQSVHASKLG